MTDDRQARLFWKQLRRVKSDVAEWPDYLKRAICAEESPAVCGKCGREMTTEEAIRSDFCPTCDPPRAALRETAP